MRKLASLALVAALGLGAATLSQPADARVVVGVGVGLPGVVIAPPVVGYAPYGVGYHPGDYWRYPHYARRGYWHGWGYGGGYHHGGYGYRGHWR